MREQFIEILRDNPLGTFIQSHPALFPQILNVHLLCFVALMSFQIILDLKVFSIWALSIEQKSKLEVLRIFRGRAVVVLLITGTMIFLTDWERLIGNSAFYFKISFLVLALLFTYLVRDRVLRQEAIETLKAKWIASISLLLWTMVALAARWIGFN